MAVCGIFNIRWRSRDWMILLVALFAFACTAAAQNPSPSPETGATQFPQGAYISYGSVITTRGISSAASASIPPGARATFSHEALIQFGWGIRRDLTFEAALPIVTNHYELNLPGSTLRTAGTGLGDLDLHLKYRFYRRDSERGTTQSSFTFGPKLPTGGTGLADNTGTRLPAGLQPGSGSVDLLFGGHWTYTGLLNIKRLVADESVEYAWRNKGTGGIKLGDGFTSRFYLSYRPYQTRLVNKEWFLGPEVLVWHTADDQLHGAVSRGTGGSALLAGAATYFSPKPGLHVWAALDFAAANATAQFYAPIRRRFVAGITKQFPLGMK
jgi:hypothetical protein